MSSRLGKISSCWIVASVAGLTHGALAVELPGKMLGELGADEFSVRETAQSELLAWSRQQPEEAMEELFRQSQVARDPEVRERCQSVLRELVMDEYMKDGEGYIGIRMQDELADVPGHADPCNVIRVIEVVKDSAAQDAGLMVNDLIAGLDGEFWHDGPAAVPFGDKVRAKRPKTKVELTVLRGEKVMQLELILGRRPLMANPLQFNQFDFNSNAAELAAREAYFRRWMSQRKLPD